MRESDIFEEIIDIGKRSGKLTYNEINDAFPSEYYSLDELEELLDLLHDMGVEVIDNREPDITEEEVLASEKKARSMKKQRTLFKHISITKHQHNSQANKTLRLGLV